MTRKLGDISPAIRLAFWFLCAYESLGVSFAQSPLPPVILHQKAAFALTKVAPTLDLSRSFTTHVLDANQHRVDVQLADFSSRISGLCYVTRLSNSQAILQTCAPSPGGQLSLWSQFLDNMSLVGPVTPKTRKALLPTWSRKSEPSGFQLYILHEGKIFVAFTLSGLIDVAHGSSISSGSFATGKF